MDESYRPKISRIPRLKSLVSKVESKESNSPPSLQNQEAVENEETKFEVEVNVVTTKDQHLLYYLGLKNGRASSNGFNIEEVGESKELIKAVSSQSNSCKSLENAMGSQACLHSDTLTGTSAAITTSDTPSNIAQFPSCRDDDGSDDGSDDDDSWDFLRLRVPGNNHNDSSRQQQDTLHTTASSYKSRILLTSLSHHSNGIGQHGHHTAVTSSEHNSPSIDDFYETPYGTIAAPNISNNAKETVFDVVSLFDDKFKQLDVQVAECDAMVLTLKEELALRDTNTLNAKEESFDYAYFSDASLSYSTFTHSNPSRIKKNNNNNNININNINNEEGSSLLQNKALSLSFDFARVDPDTLASIINTVKLASPLSIILDEVKSIVYNLQDSLDANLHSSAQSSSSFLQAIIEKVDDPTVDIQECASKKIADMKETIGARLILLENEIFQRNLQISKISVVKATSVEIVPTMAPNENVASMISAVQAENKRLTEELNEKTATHEEELAGLHDSHMETIAKHLGNLQGTLEEHTRRLQREHGDLIANMKARHDAEIIVLKTASEEIAATMARKQSIAINVIDTLKTRIDHLSKDNRSLEERLEDEMKISSSLRSSLEELNIEFTKNRTEAKSATDRYESMTLKWEAERKQIEDDLAAHKDEISSHKEAIDKHLDDLDDHKDKLSMYEIEIHALRKHREEMEAEKNGLYEVLEAKIVAHAEELAGLGDSHKKTMAKHLDDHSEKVRQYEIELSALRAARESLEAEMQAKIAAHEAETARMHGSHKETIAKHLSDDQEALEEHIRRLQREHGDLMANMKAHYDAEIGVLKVMSEENAATIACRESVANNVIDTLKTRIDQLSKDNKSLEEQLVYEIEMSSSLRSSLKELNIEFMKYKAEAESETFRYECMILKWETERRKKKIRVYDIVVDDDRVAHKDSISCHNGTIENNLDDLDDDKDKLSMYEIEIDSAFKLMNVLKEQHRETPAKNLEADQDEDWGIVSVLTSPTESVEEPLVPNHMNPLSMFSVFF